MIRLLFLIVLLLTGGIAHAQPVPPTGCTTLACTGTALPLGSLSVAGAQLQVGAGNNVRPACVTYSGSGAQADFTAMRKAGFNCVSLGWRDAWIAAPTFDDEFGSAPWLAHEAWQSGDKWSFVGTNFHTGTSQGPTWWANPIDTPTAASVYSNTGGHLNLSLIKTPAGNGIANTTMGALVNNQRTPGGLVQLFGDHHFSVAVAAVPGFLYQWNIECLPATCSDSGMELDVGIWTNGDGSKHVRFWNQTNGSGNPIYYETTSTDITQQHDYEVDWRTDFLTFYIDGVQLAQVTTPGGEFKTAGAFTYHLTSDATYFGYGPAPNTANLPATAVVDYDRIYQTRQPTAPAGCNSLTQIQSCVANATTAGLAVVFNHLGNEVPSGGCVQRQLNGLWFDQGTDSGGDDGCGDGSNWTAAAFQQNTVNLLGAFAGNSSVVGYEFHNEPLVAGAFTTLPPGPSTGNFTVNSSGQIIDPNGVSWVARGVNVTLSQRPTVAQVQTFAPRTNYIRIWGDYTQWTPSSLNSYFTSFTDLGIAVQVEDYTGNGPCRTGSDLTNANNWYKAAATYYSTTNPNRFVVFESQNECYNTPGSDSMNQIVTNYNAVRAGGYTGLFFIGSAGGAPDQVNGAWYFSNTSFAPMTNIAFDIHPYPGAYNAAANQSAYNTQLKGWVSAYSVWHTNTEAKIPVIAGEIGNCGNTQQCNSNNTPESNWQLAVHAVAQVATTAGVASGSQGVGYWEWSCGCDGSNIDTLVLGGNATNPYGVQVQGDLAGMPGTGPTPFTPHAIAAPLAALPRALAPRVTAPILTDGVALTQTQVDAVAAAINTQQQAEVPGGECFGLPCKPQDFLIGDTIIATAAQTQKSGDIGSLTDSAGDVWTLVGGTTADGNPPAWWWGGVKRNGAFPQNGGVDVLTAYFIAIRLLNNGEVWVEEAKQGGWWSLTQAQAGNNWPWVNGVRPGLGPDPGAGPNNVVTPPPLVVGIPPVNWGGGGPTDIQAACGAVGAAVYAVNPAVVEFCPGPINNAGTLLLDGTTSKTIASVASNNISDLSAVQAHPVTGFPASKVAYSIHLSPNNVAGSTPDTPLATAVSTWNSYFGYLEKGGIAPVLNLSVGCACDNSQGQATDDAAFMGNWVAYANGIAAGGPSFTGTQQPMGNGWNFWGNASGNPNGTLNNDATLRGTQPGQSGGQAYRWSQLLQGADVGPPPGPTATMWNASDQANVTVTGNGLIATSAASGIANVRATNAKSSGKYCWEVSASTISTDWGVGIANSSFPLTLGLSADGNGMGFFPGNLGGVPQAVFLNGSELTVGTNPSISGDKITECQDFDAGLAWVTDTRMRTDSGAGAWNNSVACNPTVAACGMSTSGLTCPCYPIYHNAETGVAVLATSGAFAVALPAGFQTYDQPVLTQSPRILIFGQNDNAPRATNDNRLALAERVQR